MIMFMFMFIVLIKEINVQPVTAELRIYKLY